MARRAQPVTDLFSVGHAAAETDDANGLGQELRDGSHAGHDNLKGGAASGAEQVQLVRDEQRDVRD